jgi:hypothetical protein
VQGVSYSFQARDLRYQRGDDSGARLFAIFFPQGIEVLVTLVLSKEKLSCFNVRCTYNEILVSLHFERLRGFIFFANFFYPHGTIKIADNAKTCTNFKKNDNVICKIADVAACY